MTLKNYPDFQSFLTTYISSIEADQDESAIKSFFTAASADQQSRVVMQAKTALTSISPESLVEFLGMEANRWFGDADEAKTWLKSIITHLSNTSDSSGGDSIIVKDSNGAVLTDGDAVTVIKDLKVKGGSSDLKRGTLIKKIRLIGDPENIECNVNGSTLVLKTCFLKKATD